MRKLTAYAEQLVAAAHALGLTEDQQVTIFGIAARMICQRDGYRVMHASPVARGRRRLNDGFDRGIENAVVAESIAPSLATL